MEVSVEEASPPREYTIPGQGHTAPHSYGGYGNAGPESVGGSSLPDSDFLDAAAARQIAVQVFEERYVRVYSKAKIERWQLKYYKQPRQHCPNGCNQKRDQERDQE